MLEKIYTSSETECLYEKECLCAKWDKVFKIGPKKICWREILKYLKEYGLFKEERGKCCIFPVQILYFYELAFLKIL